MISIVFIFMKSIEEIIQEELLDYRGSHQAPEPSDSDSPMYDVTMTYGEDIYGPQAMRLYGHRPYDNYSISLIQRARNKPNMQVKIYRAIPKVISNQEKIDDYTKRMKEIQRRGKLPRDATNWRNPSEYYEWLDSEIERLMGEPSGDKVKINNGDWVTINPAYAREHGQSNIGQFRVLTKTVSAKNLYNEGDVNEWGYNEGISENLNENLNESTNFQKVPNDLYIHFRQRQFGDEANRSHMKVFKAKDGREFLIRKIINQDIFYAYDLQDLQNPIGVAVFDDSNNQYFTGYEHRQSIEVKPDYRRLGIASALTDLGELILGKPYKPTNLQTPEMQGFSKNRLGEENKINPINNNSKKLYYHGRSKSRPYSGKYIFITDNLGYASGYSDGQYLYEYTIPFNQDKIFSIKNAKHLAVLNKYVDKQNIEAIITGSGSGQEIDWATLGYISNNDYDMPEDLLESLGFYGVRLKERQGIDSIYIFNQDKLDYQGTLDISTPEMKDKIGKFYKDFAKGKNLMESIADKYAEKEFNIQDPNVQQDISAKGALQKDLEKPYGYANKIAIYKNPQTLENFDSDVRAIGTVSGNLYVAQKNGMLMHGQMGEYIHLDNSSAIYSGKYLLLNRDGNTNNFILSDTAEEDYPKYWEYFNNIMKNIETKNPYKILASIDHVD